MNIFFLDADPAIAAHYYCDQHIGKIRVEICQLLSSAFYNNDNILILERENGNFINGGDIFYKIYKKSHYNHPMAKWVRRGYLNWAWAFLHLRELQKIWLSASKNGTITEDIIFNLSECFKFLSFEETGFTKIPLCIYEELKNKYGIFGNIDDAVIAYRDYYNHKKFKNGLPTFKINGQPEWYKNINDS